MKFVNISGTRRELGGKAHTLSLMAEEDFPIPAWFAVSPEAFEQSLSIAQRAAIAAGDADEIRSALKELTPAPAMLAEITAMLRQFPSEGLYAVRSSAIDEDSGNHSFAGQLDSYLCVPGAAISERVADVWRSGFNQRVLAYRQHQRLTPLSRMAPAVIIQRMVNAEMAGVAFSADPVSGRRGVAVVSAVFGLATILVSGESDSDVYEVDGSEKVLRVSVATKLSKHGYDSTRAEGIASFQVAAEQQSLRVLSDEQACAIAALARRVERRFGPPQDIEWAIEGNKLYLLQARPITTLRHIADPDAQLSIWDNSNISESYGGITTPLTFSFARAAYEGVYREFYRLSAVSPSAINSHAQNFRNMIGLIRGRVYYNLLNWYRLLELLPGYADNREFLEQMLGLNQVTPKDNAKTKSEKSLGRRVLRHWYFARAMAAILRNYLIQSRRTKAFYARLNETLEPAPAFDIMRADELAQHYCDLISKLMVNWNAPSVNDFLVMIFHGWLRRLSRRWLDRGDELTNDLARASGTMISVEPAVCLSELATEIATHHPALIQHLCESEPMQAVAALRQVPELREKYGQYLARFGDRCLEELKLESPTLYDDPTPLLRRLGALSRAKASAQAPRSQIRDSTRCAIEETNRILRWHPLRRLIFHWVLRNSRRFICQRENLRFARTCVFARVRRIFVEIGRRFRQSNVLEDARDIFYLQVEEILGFIQGTAVTTNLKDLVAIRKCEFDTFRDLPAPANRFETRGPVYQGNSFQSSAVEETMADDDERHGLGSCPGRVRAEVSVITNPREASITPGRILVAERTDPGWIMFFPGAAGLIVERGSLLSHSAIVSRELRIPCVVSVAGATQWLRTGDVVELDGGLGIVRRVEKQKAQAP